MEVARQWKERADKLLAESRLLDLLARYGEVNFSGGYAYDVMMTLASTFTSSCPGSGERLPSRFCLASWISVGGRPSRSRIEFTNVFDRRRSTVFLVGTS